MGGGKGGGGGEVVGEGGGENKGFGCLEVLFVDKLVSRAFGGPRGNPICRPPGGGLILRGPKGTQDHHQRLHRPYARTSNGVTTHTGS